MSYILFLVGVVIGIVIGAIFGMLLLVICTEPVRYDTDRRDWDEGR
jgi:hypothetical protein